MAGQRTHKPYRVLTAALIWGGGGLTALADAWVFLGVAYTAYYVIVWQPGGNLLSVVLNSIPVLVSGGALAFGGRAIRRWGLRRRDGEPLSATSS